MQKEDVKWLHVELSTKCNAWCPACTRNKLGYGLSDWLVEEDLSLEVLKNVLDQFSKLEGVQLCGNYGDPIASENILPAISLIKQYTSKIQIHTNGSLRNSNWWQNLALLLSDIEHDVWFGIDGLDGLDGVHEIYRQGTSYKKIIENATAFINKGGHATWQFIPFAHNEHQLLDCIRLSQQLKFKKFKLVKLFRNKTLVRHYRSGSYYELNPPAEFQKLIRFDKIGTKVDESNCMHLSQSGIYLSASGKLSRCCYQNIYDPLFDTVDELLYNNVDLTVKSCLISCGS